MEKGQRAPFWTDSEPASHRMEGLNEHCKLPQRVLGQSPNRKCIFGRIKSPKNASCGSLEFLGGATAPYGLPWLCLLADNASALVHNSGRIIAPSCGNTNSCCCNCRWVLMDSSLLVWTTRTTPYGNRQKKWNWCGAEASHLVSCLLYTSPSPRD